MHTLHAVFNEQWNIKVEGKEASLENRIHDISQLSSKFKLHACTKCVYVTCFRAPCPYTCLGSFMSESRCEHSATYRRLQANQQITDVVSLKLRFATEFSFAHNTVVLKSAGRGSVCALSHFTPVYTTVLTSWWVSEDMSLPTTRQPALNMPTWRCWQSWKYITFSLRPTIQLHSALTIYTIVWLTDIFDFVHRLIFLPNNGVSEANPASLFKQGKNLIWRTP